MNSSGPFQFRDLHPGLFVGTASDRYAGWIGQIYSPGRYDKGVKTRDKKLGDRTFQETVLPVSSVEEYFEHFGVLELDSTFYALLLGTDGKPTPTWALLSTYGRYIPDGDRVLLKVPQAVSAAHRMKGGRFVPNETYLDAEIFTRQFYVPACDLLGDRLHGFIFEQEYTPKNARLTPEAVARDMDAFFARLPRDRRYHLELRTEPYLRDPLFEVLQRHGVGQVLSHWTYLPPLRQQFALSGNRVLNAGGELVVRLLTPRGMKYADAYARAHPFAELREDMLDPAMVGETVEVVRSAIQAKARTNVIVNNRAGGNAPLIAQRIKEAFLCSVSGGPAREPNRLNAPRSGRRAGE